MRYSSYKIEHEAFVSNLKGTSIACIIACLLHIPALILLLKIFQTSRRARLIRDYFVFVFPLILTITVLADYNYVTIALLGLLIVYLTKADGAPSVIISSKQLRRKDSQNDWSHSDSYYITLFKGANVIMTCLAILAIDFRIFPRRFGKTETFGISLMDVGVGTFIISSAITSRHARGIPLFFNKNSQENKKEKSNLWGNFLGHLFSVQRFLVLLLGFGRMIMLKLSNYQEHVSEYGIHWNFFVTLYAVWTLTDIFHFFIPRKYLVWVALFGLILYQIALVNYSLTDFILSSPRNSFFLANKEGFISLFGYIPMFLFAESFAFNIMHARGAIYKRNDKSESLTPSEANAENENQQNSDPWICQACLLNDQNPTALKNSKNTLSTHKSIDFGGYDDDAVWEGERGKETQLLPEDPTSTSSPTSSSTMKEGREEVNCICCYSRRTSTTESLNDETEEKNSTSKSLADSQEGTKGKSENTNLNQTSTLSDSFLGWWKFRYPVNVRRVKHLTLSSIVLWVAWLAGSSIQPTSRRLVNLTFVALSLALSMSLLLLIYLADAVVGGRTVSGPLRTLEYCSTHSLVVFLVANLLTGLINMSIKTIYVSHAVALLILSIYGGVLVITAHVANLVLSNKM